MGLLRGLKSTCRLCNVNPAHSLAPQAEKKGAMGVHLAFSLLMCRSIAWDLNCPQVLKLVSIDHVTHRLETAIETAISALSTNPRLSQYESWVLPQDGGCFVAACHVVPIRAAMKSDCDVCEHWTSNECRVS